ncbi:UNVERIFIED_CONTAM: hypothetical protein K2H54_020076 [Gekko kuhli]
MDCISVMCCRHQKARRLLLITLLEYSFSTSPSLSASVMKIHGCRTVGQSGSSLQHPMWVSLVFLDESASEIGIAPVPLSHGSFGLPDAWGIFSLSRMTEPDQKARLFCFASPNVYFSRTITQEDPDTCAPQTGWLWNVCRPS